MQNQKTYKVQFLYKVLTRACGKWTFEGLEWSHMKEVKAPPQTNL